MEDAKPVQMGKEAGQELVGGKTFAQAKVTVNKPQANVVTRFGKGY